MKRIALPKAWIQKYLRPASLFRDMYLPPRNNKGTSPRKLISIPAQTKNQLDEDKLIIGPHPITKKNNTFADDIKVAG